MSLDIKEIKSVFNKVKKFANSEFLKGNYEDSLSHIETAADIAYMFNWIYADNELESLLSAISKKIIDNKKEFSPRIGKFVFYDVFALDNRGLTQQYLRALISWEVEILFVFEGNDLSKSNNILEEIKNYSKAELFIVDKNLSKVDKIKIIYSKISQYKPEKAFMHLLPSSVVAVTIFNSLKEITKYQINLTDHAFWLGSKCIDYCLEFRDYGCNVSYEKRNISENKLLIQPYYPILDCQPFKGFPLGIEEDAIKVFTGGSYYKMYGKSDFFFKLLKIIFDLNSKVVVILAGNGDDTPIKNFISVNKYEKRLFLIGSRSDITYVFQNCDIYLSTFPVTGGLMGQYAAILSKPILSFSTEDIPCNFSEGFMNWNMTPDFKITHTNLESFKEEANRMIDSESYRKKKGEENKKHIITESEFSVCLKQLVTSNKMNFVFKKELIDYEVFSDIYVERENNYLKEFDVFIVSKFKFKALVFFPKQFLLFIFSFTNWKRHIKNLHKKIKI